MFLYKLSNQHILSFLLDKYLGVVEWLNLRRCMFNFLRTHKTLSRETVVFIFPPAVYEKSSVIHFNESLIWSVVFWCFFFLVF